MLEFVIRRKFWIKDFIPNAYHDDVVDDALGQQKKNEVEMKSGSSTSADNRLTWTQSLITKRPIRALAKEFAAHKKIKPIDFTTEAYEKNDAKNRYNDIVCIDATRVVLKDRSPENDYIHASWMTMPTDRSIFVTQGPLQEYVGDFWHMIVTEKSKVIVMLCNFNEGKHEKCCFYLPKEKSDIGSYGCYIVSVKSSKPDPFEGIKHTEFDVRWSDNKTFMVHHIAYFDWPDHTAPLDPKPTVGAFKLARTLAHGNPITVHCSAGIGRSATFIAIDYAAQKIRDNAEASMIDVIKDLRSQRYQAIQSAIQYVFLHVCLLEYFAEENAKIRDSKFNDYMESYASMIKRYNKKVEAKQREQSKAGD
ncbi:Protein-tyrosine phosphatase [Dictyocaulus viviparus]|uniref:Protein-tyrosine phosphatase n=1 Tax=Dictyocaulus viviparus TaxID=29172 RepID=A0A0D8XNQ1_DICVI|nr:Protein-tyrosine phosphatase [Dictyocaulus viviparus]